MAVEESVYYRKGEFTVLVLRPRLCLGRNFPEAPLPVARVEAELRESAFPGRAWERVGSSVLLRPRLCLGRNLPEAPLPVARVEAELRESAFPG